MRRLLVATLLCIPFVASTFGQTSNGQIGGIVQDASKALIPGATITVINVDTALTYSQITNESGSYSFPSVPPGSYRVTASLPGFKTATASGVQVGTAAQVRQNFTLEVGTVSTNVEVSVATDRLLAESSASVGDVLPAQRALDLPLVGNDILDLVRILPGYRQGTFNVAGVGIYDVFAGQTVDSVNVTRDGLSVNDGANDPRLTGLTTTTNINPELVGEIRLILAPVDAELGRGNTQIQIMTRSGTNRYTGSAVWNIQNTALNANTWANNKNIVNGAWSPLRPDWRNTHDLTLTYGGPIIRNKTFFFVSWEQQKSNTRSLQTNTVWTDQARQGIFRYWEKWIPDDAAGALPTYPATAASATRPATDYSGNPVRPDKNPDGSDYVGNLICFSVFGNVKANGNPFTPTDCPGGTAVINSSPWDSFRTTMDSTGHIAKLLDAMPRANYFATGDGLNTAGFQWLRGTRGQGGANASAGVSDFVNRKQINIKIDQNFNARHRVSGSWSYQHDDSADFIPAWPGALNGDTRRRPQVLTVTGTSTLSSSMLNEARFGLRYNVTGRYTALENANTSTRETAKSWYLNGGTSANGAPYLVGFQPAGVGNGFINLTSQSSGNTSPLYNYADTFSWTRSRHSFKLGADVRLTGSTGFNSTGGNVVPVATGGASAGLASALAQTGTGGIFTSQLTNFLNGARTSSANLLYFLNASIANASMLRWIDDASDVTNGHWEDVSTVGKKYRDQVAREWSAFWKDDWKFTKNLTLNLGVRYDYYGSPFIGSGFTSAPVGQGAGLFGVNRLATDEMWDRWLRPGSTFLTGYGSNAAPGSALACAKGVANPNGIPTSTCDPTLLTQIEFVGPNTPNPNKTAIPVDRNNFSPAIGFAWQVPWFGEGKTTVRGGYQITYSTTGRDASALDALLGSAPGNTHSATTQVSDQDIAAILSTRALNLRDLPTLVPVRALLAPGDTVPVYGRSTSFDAYSPDFKTPYTQNLTLQITRSLRRNMTVDVRYVGTFARKMAGEVDLNLSSVFDNPELLDALTVTRAGGNAKLFDLMFAGLNVSSVTTDGYGPVGTCTVVVGAPGGEGCPAGQVRQHGSAHLRRNATYTSNLANGNFVGVINSLRNTSTVSGNTLQPLPTGVTGVSARVLRNGCDRLANGLTNIETRCFPENYFIANPQLSSAGLQQNQSHNNFHSMQIQFLLRPTQGTSLQSTYTWSKLLTDRYTSYVDPRNRQQDYSLDYASYPHEFRTNGTFELPIGPNRLLFGNSSGWVARLLERWQTSFIFQWGAGPPRDTFVGQTLYVGGGGSQPQARPEIVGAWVNPKTDFKWNGPNNDSGTIFGYPSPYVTFDDPQCLSLVGASDEMGLNLRSSCTMNGLAKVVPQGTPGAVLISNGVYGIPLLINPLPGKQGNQGARTLKLPGRRYLDGNISKSFRLSESKSIQIRVDANNILNHPNPGEPNFNVQSDDFGRVTSNKTTAPRQFQAQVRLSF